MKKIMYLVTLIVTLASAQVSEAQTKPSGYYSMNGQQTVGNGRIYYASVDEWINFLAGGELPQGITEWNPAHIDNVRVSHNRKFFQDHADIMRAMAISQLEKDLNQINEYTEGVLTGDRKVEFSRIRGYLLTHVKIMYLESTDPIYLLGVYGDFTRPGWVKHLNGSGKYYVLQLNDGRKFILARVSCWNLVTTTETLWLEKGTAKVSSGVVPTPNRTPTETVPVEEGVEGGETVAPTKTTAPTTTIGGDDFTKVTTTSDSQGRVTNIYISSKGGNGGSVIVGDITAKGGASNNNNSNSGNNQTESGSSSQRRYGPDDQYYYQPQGPRVVYSNGGVVHKDATFEYIMSQPRPVYPQDGLMNRWFGNNCNAYGYYYNGGNQYMVGGAWNNGYFQPDWGQCYQRNGGVWRALGQIAAGFFNNATFCGGYYQQASGHCWAGPTNRGWNNCNRGYNNTWFNNNPAPQFTGPNMGWTIPANAYNPGAVVPNQGGPQMGYTFR